MPIALLTVAAFLIPLIGGQLPNDVGSLAPGYVPAVQALFRGTEVATLQHALLALLVIGAFVTLIVRRKIVQVPHVWMSASLAALLALLLASVFMSDYRWVSQTSFAEWMVYAIALVACVAGLGRRIGPIAVLSGLSAGTGLVALMGLLEFASMRQERPDWRIFSTWNNPNALAGMLLIGLFVSLGIVISRKSAFALLAGASAVLAGIAIVLTGSKGGVLAAGCGGVALIGALAVWRQPKAILQVALCFVVIGIGLFAIESSGRTGSPGLRLAEAGQTQEQSAGFRLQLWKGAISLIEENPIGRGLGAYDFYSAKPGSNTRTVLAHDTYLQLGVEAGILAPLCLILFLLAWLFQSFRSARALPADRNALRAGVLAAVVATAAHGVVESNLYYFGIGLSLFLVLGVGIQLSADAGAPEFVAPPMRISAVVVAILVLGQVGFAGFIGVKQAELRGFLLGGDLSSARETSEGLQSLAPFDGETWYRSGFIARTPSEAISDFERAARVAPSAKYFRRLALAQIGQNQYQPAEDSLRKALTLDPNNLEALQLLYEAQDKEGRPEDARETAKRLVEVEQTPYFKIRSIAEVVPTQTYEARLFLAKFEPGNLSLIRPAIEGFLEYNQLTVPYAKQMGGVVGMSYDDVLAKIKLARDSAKGLEQGYRAKGDRAGEAWARKAVTAFDATLAGGSK